MYVMTGYVEGGLQKLLLDLQLSFVGFLKLAQEYIF